MMIIIADQILLYYKIHVLLLLLLLLFFMMLYLSFITNTLKKKILDHSVTYKHLDILLFAKQVTTTII